ncbi:Ubiquitin-like protein [Eutypa lata]|nr:Ubiquitin-like protein [Eutypa lata]
MEYPEAPSRSPSPYPSPNIPELEAEAEAADNDNDNDNDNSPATRPASPDLPLTMTASAVLTSLPRDASAALASAGDPFDDRDRKVVVRFKAVGGSAPQLRRDVRKVGAAQRFEAVVLHLRRALKVAEGQGLFLYVNSAFAPALDEVVGNLHRCFKDSNDQLIVAYSITPAFG